MNHTVNLTAVFSQFKEGFGPKTLESDLNVEVEYDPEERTYTQIIRVWTYNYRYKTVTDITAILADTFSKQLDEMLEHIDFWELYCDKRRERVA